LSFPLFALLARPKVWPWGLSPRWWPPHAVLQKQDFFFFSSLLFILLSCFFSLSHCVGQRTAASVSVSPFLPPHQQKKCLANQWGSSRFPPAVEFFSPPKSSFLFFPCLKAKADRSIHETVSFPPLHEPIPGRPFFFPLFSSSLDLCPPPPFLPSSKRYRAPHWSQAARRGTLLFFFFSLSS